MKSLNAKASRSLDANGTRAAIGMPTRRARPGAGPARPGESPRQWLAIPDPDEDRIWMFDVTFLTSSWTCIYGAGCQGVLTGPTPELAQGCCSYGAHLTGIDDARRVEAAALELTPDQWQFHKQGQPRPGRSGVLQRLPSGELSTRLVKEACIFLNRPGFPGGPGCALHRAALETRRLPLELKPDVCWQLPLRCEDHQSEDGRVISMVGEWERRHWGSGGEDFHWWCTEAPEAFTGTAPLFETLRDELTAIVGPKVYKLLKKELRKLLAGSNS